MKRKYILPAFLIVQIISLQLLSFFPEVVERIYSNGLYVWISVFMRVVLGKIPFSVGDICYLIVIYFVLKWFWNKRKSWRSQWKNNLLQMSSVLSIFYFFFHFFWGINYYRVPLFEKMAISKDYSDADLLNFTAKLITKTNAIHHEITKNDSLKVEFPYSKKQVFNGNSKGFQSLATLYPYFDYSNPSVKKSIISLPLTYMGFGGYLNPFTNEAQVNYLGPMYNFPTTTCHEMAHQLGYASESEANFIGFLASIKNKDKFFQYSGYSFALRYCLHYWLVRDETVLKQLLTTIHPGILANYKESEQFWEEYETFIDTGFRFFYDRFLKINQQREGIESYSRFVDLMVNYYKDKAL